MALLTSHPPSEPVLGALLSHFLRAPPTSPTGSSSVVHAQQPVNKKRKLEPAATGADDPHLWTVQSLSFTSPARRKFWLRVHEKTIHVVVPQTEDVVESYRLEDVTSAVCLPTPEKVKPHFTVCLFFRAGRDPVVFGFDAAANGLVVVDPERRPRTPQAIAVGASAKDIVLALLDGVPNGVMEPDPRDFSVAAPYGKPRLVYTTCHFKSKQSWLYFFPRGILLGFQKPVTFFPLSEVTEMTVGQEARHFHVQFHQVPAGTDDSTPTAFAFEYMELEAKGAVLNYLDRYRKVIGQPEVATTTTTGTARVKVKGERRDLKSEDDVEEVDMDVVELMDSDEEDDDYQPTDRPDVPEEFDSGHEANDDDEEDDGSVAGSDGGRAEDDQDDSDVEELEMERKHEVPRTMVRGLVDQVVGSSRKVKGEKKVKREVVDMDQDQVVEIVTTSTVETAKTEGRVKKEENVEEVEMIEVAQPKRGGMAAIAAQVEAARRARGL
ncbi:hypothetical protein HKX48_000575 [Thoreauomyces humboldtii]|nr:hypothetical protein HKX48_000575 [Thoreauomyces humboldtii]